MKTITKKHFVFITKSMLWSALLYVVLMLIFNWDTVSSNAKNCNAVAVISEGLPPAQPDVTEPAAFTKSIAKDAGIVKKIVVIAHSISEIVGINSK